MTFHPSQTDKVGDAVLITHADAVAITGNKAEQKLYRYHTGWPGGLKEITYETMSEKKPENIIRAAVSGMLPKNRQRKILLRRLQITTGEGPDAVYRPLEVNARRRAKKGEELKRPATDTAGGWEWDGAGLKEKS